jgi:transcriptional regulator with XRE-family HTH domain
MSQQEEPNVGQRIRAMREHRGLSLRALAERSGLSINAISLIERGENSPTVSSLHLLATALRVPITTFFEDESEQATVFVRRDRRLRSQSDGFVMESLGIGLRNQQMEPFLVTIEPGAGNVEEPITHSGEELVYCLEGAIEYRVGREAFHLQAGDSLLFEASQPHAMVNTASDLAVLILVFQVGDGRSPAGQHHLGEISRDIAP